MVENTKILIIDDEKSFCEEVATFLRREKSWSVDTTYNGKEAMQKIVRTSYDLVLLDLYMSGMSGIEVLQELAEEEDIFDQMYIIVISSYLDHDRIWKAVRLGARDFIRKGRLYDDLIVRVKMGVEWQKKRIEREQLVSRLTEMESFLKEFKELGKEFGGFSADTNNMKEQMEKIKLLVEKLRSKE